MKQLSAITNFLVELNLVAAEQIDSWVENPQVIVTGTFKGANSLVIHQQKYTALIAIERYPHRKIPVELLLAQISAWLIENDGERADYEDAKITTDVEIMDDETADIEIGIDFIEEVEIVEYPGGPIQLNGKRYQLRELVLNYALTGDVAA